MGLPELGFAIYIGLNLAIWAIFYKTFLNQDLNPHYVAFLVGFGPVIIAQVMANLTESSKRSIFYPFHKDGWKALSGHLLISATVCIGPVYILAHTLLSNPGDSFYFWLRN